MKQGTKYLIVLLCGIFISSPFAQNGADLLQKALRKEQVDGDLKGAIELYRQIATEHASSRALAAQALVQLGKAYEKMGASEARAAYAKVVSDFADQSREVSEAKVRLAALKEAQPADGDRQPIVRLIAADTTDRWLAIGDSVPSPDGKYVSYVNWDHGNLGIYNVETGERRDLTTEGTWSGPDQFAWSGGIFSPDSTQIAYFWSVAPHGELRIVHRDGGKSRVLVADGIYPQSWSSDGKIVALGPYRAAENSRSKAEGILLIDASTGATNMIKRFTGGHTSSRLALSPDGKFIAYVNRWQDPGSTNSTKSDIHMIRSDGSDDHALIEHPAEDVTPAWMPDGKHLLFVSDRSGSSAIWAVAVSNGRRMGEPRRIRDGIARGHQLSVSSDGSVYFYARSPNFNIYTAEANFDDGKMGPQKLVSLRYDGKNHAPKWSSDGSKLGYVSFRIPAVLVFQNAATGAEEEVKPEWGFSAEPAWSPDLSRLIGPAQYPSRPGKGLVNVDVKSGRRTWLEIPNPTDDVSGSVFTPDGQNIIYNKHSWSSNDPPGVLVELNLQSMQERVICRELAGYNMPVAISPDGKRLAALKIPYPIKSQDTAKLLLTTRADGVTKTVVEFSISENGGGAGSVWDWLPDNRRLILSLSDKDYRRLYVVDVETGKYQQFGPDQPKVDPIVNVTVHPDGKRIAFKRGRAIQEYWSLKNFLPEEKEVAAKDQPVIRQVASDKLGPWVAFGSGTPSPDGRYLAYVNWTHGNLALADLKNETLKDLTTEGTWNSPDQFTFGGIWSPDSRQIAYLWMKGGDGDLRIIEREGGEARTVVPASKGGRIVPQAWSRDGRYIYGFTFSQQSEPARTNKIVRVELATGVVTDVKEFPGPTAWMHLSVSPDEKYIAYHYPGAHQLKYMGKDPVPSQIRLVRSDGTGDRHLMDHPAEHALPYWTPDGKHLLFSSDRSGSDALWTLPIRNGAPAGEPRIVRDLAGAVLGLTDDGTLFYSAGSLSYNVFVAEADFAAGTMGIPKMASVRFEGKNRNPQWSVDGKQLAYVSRRNNPVLVFQEIATGKEEDIEVADAQFSRRPQWSPDLTRMTGPARVPGGNVWGLFNLDVKTRERTLLVKEAAAWGLFTPDGRSVIYQRDSGAEQGIIERDLQDGRERLISANRMRQPVLSPDGQTLAHLQRPYPVQPGDTSKIMITSVTDGSTKMIHELPAGLEIHLLDWLPDNRQLLVRSTEKGAQQLRLVDTVTKSDRPFGPPITEGQIAALSVHPDGKRVAFQRGKQVEEIWTMKNFLTEEKVAAK